jgi:eukaryotic-like serine/threonine-protein kinase
MPADDSPTTPPPPPTPRYTPDDAPTSANAPTVHTSKDRRAVGERPGDTIGDYTLLAVLGEGGFGMVWLAERREPVVQRVALKVIKPGMDTRSVIARFEQERQALAVMNHPNVAKVFDAGATSAGRPFFVMEYVPGESITSFADRHKLPIRDRLALMLPVCEAVQHAHMKGIIHRDLKPSNILVSIPDGRIDDAARRAVPKVIDFGVAKAIDHTLTDKTLFTELGHIVGTPEYMSPEQADSRNHDIDTRTDVYALGCVLYELLTGALPFDPRSLRSAGYAEIQRIIRNVDPPNPSTRLSGLGELATEIAERRGAKLDQLESMLRSELEWIPLKAMRKNRAERYTTPSELADDIRNYLESRPLIAAPESRAYRARKFIAKHRGAMITSGVVAASLIAATVVSTISLIRERAARHEAQVQRDTAEAVNDFLNDDLLSATDPDSASGVGKGVETRVIDVLDPAAAGIKEQFKDRPDVEARVASTLGNAYIAIGRPRQAEEILRRAAELTKGRTDENTFRVTIQLAESMFRQGKYDESIAYATQELAVISARFGPRDVHTNELRNIIAGAHKHAGKLDEAETIYKDLLAIRTTDYPQFTRDIAVTKKNLALIDIERARLLARAGDKPGADKRYETALVTMRGLVPDFGAAYSPEHPETLSLRSDLPKLLFWLGRTDEAAAEFDALIPILNTRLGPMSWRTLDARAVQANMFRSTGRCDLAADRLSKLLEDYRFVRGPVFRDTITVATWLADCFEKLGRVAEAQSLLERTFAELNTPETQESYKRFACRLRDFYLRHDHAEKAERLKPICHS